MRRGPWLCMLLAAFVASAARAEAPSLNGFTLDPSSVPPQEILRGGPPRDGIPALEDPATVDAPSAPWAADELVLGVEVGGEARAYPVAILNWHELVNDELGGTPILITYCPLCGTGIVFERRIDSEPATFGVSGLLYKSDVLFFDRETESLWSQIESKAITGRRLGQRLRVVRSQMDQWGAWRDRHPHTTVLSLETGQERDYQRDPYAGYADSPRLAFPAPLDERYHPKMPTLGIRTLGGAARAYPGVELVQAGGEVEESFEGRSVRVAYDPERQIFDVEAPDDLEVIEGFWFAWSAFHPAGSVFVAVPSAGPEALPVTVPDAGVTE